jgi:hypothetical protein
MDILLENMAHTLPETRDPLDEIYACDPFDILEAMYEPGMCLAAPVFALDIC